MRIKTKLLLSFTLASAGVALAGASGIMPLMQVERVLQSAAPAVRIDVEHALYQSLIATCLATSLTVGLGCLIARAIVNTLARLRSDADALTNRTGEAIRLRGDEFDGIAHSFNE